MAKTPEHPYRGQTPPMATLRQMDTFLDEEDDEDEEFVATIGKDTLAFLIGKFEDKDKELAKERIRKDAEIAEERRRADEERRRNDEARWRMMKWVFGIMLVLIIVLAGVVGVGVTVGLPDGTTIGATPEDAGP